MPPPPTSKNGVRQDDGTELGLIEESVSGEPVVVIHGAVATAFVPLFREDALTSHYPLVSYNRRGYGKVLLSVRRAQGQFSATRCYCSMLVERLSIDKTHIMGQSRGAQVALQLASDIPEKVHSLSLLDPALFLLVPSAPS